MNDCVNTKKKNISFHLLKEYTDIDIYMQRWKSFVVADLSH